MDYFLSFIKSNQPSININLNKNSHKKFKINVNNNNIEFPVYFLNDKISGEILIELNQNKFLEHKGIKINLIGIIQKQNEILNKFYDDYLNLTSNEKINNEITKINFDFSLKKNIENESFYGTFIKIKYFLLVTIFLDNKNLTNKKEIVILKPTLIEDYKKFTNFPMKIEIGVENKIHVILEINKNNYFLRDIIIGKVIFVNVNIIIKTMFIQIIRKENLNFNNEFSSETIVLNNFEIMDDNIEKNNEILFRFYLNGIKNLTPNYENIDKKIKIEYFLNIEIIDVNNNRFFKKIEIKLTRLNKMNRKDLFLFNKENIKNFL
jgi:vacuolar protein sorting-associated protein 26